MPAATNNPAVAELLKRTRTDRGLPARITDQTVLARVARIVSSRGGDAR